MTLHSVWGSNPPSGDYTMFNDGSPSIGLFQRFYMVNRPSTGGAVGVKVWIPTVKSPTNFATPETLTIIFWGNGGSELDSVTLTKTVPLTATPGSWQEVFFDALVPFPAQSTPRTQMGVFYYFGNDAADQQVYVFSGNARASGVPTASQTFPDLIWSEDQSAFRMPRTGGLNGASSPQTAYGIDLIITDDNNWTPPGAATEYGTTVAEENAFAGSPKANWWDGLTHEAMPAFSRSTYVEPGATINFSVDYNEAFNFDVYRLGHYQNNGARLVDTNVAGTPAAQPAPVVIPNSNGAVTCAAWSQNASWDVPADALPGWYQVILKGQGGAVGGILFLVADTASKRPVVVVTGDATWHAAYNGYGSNNLYGNTKGIAGTAVDRALCSTYDKPVITRDYVPQTHFMNNTYPVVKFYERMGFEVAGATIEQIKNDPTILDGRDLIIFAGHNEYIPDTVYDKVDVLLEEGQRMINIAGNDFFWRVKFTDGAFDSGNNGRVMWCKKDTMNGPGGHVAGQPFTTQEDWTGTWQDTRYTNRRPSEDTFGDRFVANGVRSDSVMVDIEYQGLPCWRNCPNMDMTEPHTFVPGSLGMEWDKPIIGNPNVNQVMLSMTSVVLTGNAADIDGQNYNQTETAEHGITMVRKGTGYICNFNSDQWGWTLDALHLRGSAAADTNAQQMMLNVMRDFGVVGNNTSIAAAGLTSPAQQSLADYGFPEPIIAYGGDRYYSDGTQWIPVGNTNSPF